MNLKRETSLSVSELHLQSSLSTDSPINKRLAFSRLETYREIESGIMSHPYSNNVNNDPETISPHYSLETQFANTNISPSSNIVTIGGATKPHIYTVMSNASDDFNAKYEFGREIGKGGFSLVYECIERTTRKSFAVKVIDLRPLRLRERFNPARLRREVDIMRRLSHPNIIQFIEVYETNDQLLMVMEYCPGSELFDVILARQYFREEDAKPIFAQVARALFYLHSMNILHRDIKPENILISQFPDPTTGFYIAKLLDFGLSKNAGAGSAAKTFVGTPCYLAPEVEHTSKGLGGTYGLPADCWSLGAVLYVMLVARFPEFEHDITTNKVVVKLSPALWEGVSSQAKELIRGLMNTNPVARLTAANACQHPWLGVEFGAKTQELSEIRVACYDMSQHLQLEEEQAEREYAKYTRGDDEMTSTGTKVYEQAMVVRKATATVGMSGGGNTYLPNGNEEYSITDPNQLAPLLNLQRRVAACFEDAQLNYLDIPEIASQVRLGALLCRQQLKESVIMLESVKQTSSEVLNSLADLEMAVEEGEAQMAALFFENIKAWVGELRVAVVTTQKANRASMMQIQTIVEHSAELIKTSQAADTKTALTLQNRLVKLIQDRCLISAPSSSAAFIDYSHISTSESGDPVTEAFTQFMEFLSIGGNNGSGNTIANTFLAALSGLVNTSAYNHSTVSNGTVSSSKAPVVTSPMDKHVDIDLDVDTGVDIIDMDIEGVHGSSTAELSAYKVDSLDSTGEEGNVVNTYYETAPTAAAGTVQNQYEMEEIDEESHYTTSPSSSSSHVVQPKQTPHTSSSSSSSLSAAPFNHNSHVMQLVIPPAGNTSFEDGTVGTAGAGTAGSSGAASPVAAAANRLADALENLKQVDKILDQLEFFWAKTELVLDALTKKGQHMEHFIVFAKNPRLMVRFKERLEEYKRFWKQIGLNCSKYLEGMQGSVGLGGVGVGGEQDIYGFLEA